MTTANSLFTVDPFTGIQETSLGGYAGDIPAVGTLRPTIGDFALRDNPLFDPTSTDPNIARRQRFYTYTQDRGDGIVTDASAGNYLWIDIDPLDQPAPPPGTVLIRGTGDAGALTDDGILTFFNAQIDPAATEPDVQPANGGQGEGILFDALTFAAPAPDIDFGYAIGHRPVAEQTIPLLDMSYTPVVNLGYVPNVLFRFNATTGAAISATGAERDEAERIPVTNPGPQPAPTIPVEQPNAGTQVVESGVLAVSYDNPDTGQREFGGNITGLAFVSGTLFGVTDKGHLYRISGQDGPGASARYMATIKDKAGKGVNFQGLSAGPARAEKGAYRTVLFGIAGNGDLYAFDNKGCTKARVPRRPDLYQHGRVRCRRSAVWHGRSESVEGHDGARWRAGPQWQQQLLLR